MNPNPCRGPASIAPHNARKAAFVARALVTYSSW